MKRRIFLVLILGLAPFAGVAAADDATPVEAAAAQARTLTGHGRFQEALAVLRKAEETLAEADDGPRARLAHVRSLVLFHAGDAEGASDASLAAVRLQRKAGDHRAALITAANALVFLGDVGRYGDALSLADEIREHVMEHAEPGDRVTFLNNLGTVYLVLSFYDEGMDVVRQSLKLATELRDERRAMQARGNLAIFMLRKADPEGALPLIEAVLASPALEQAPHQHGITWLVHAQALQELGRHKAAHQSIDRAQTLFERIGDLRRLAAVEVHRGWLFKREGDAENTLKALRRAQAGYERIGVRDLELANSHEGASWALLKLGRPKEALDEAKRAAALDRLYGPDLSEKEGAALDRRASNASQRGVEAALAWSETDPAQSARAFEDAFALSETGRGRRLASAIANPGTLVSGGLTPALRQLDRNSRAATDQARRALLQTLRAPQVATSQVDAAKQRLDDAWSARVLVVSRIRRQAARAAAIVYPEPVDLDAFRGQQAACCALLSFHLQGERAVGLLVTKERVRIVHLGAPAEVRSDVKGYLRLVATPGGPESKLARRLYKRLLEPLLEGLQDKTRLIVVPDLELTFLPFAALLNGDGERVAARHEVVYAPSATIYHALRGHKAKSGRGLLAVGDPRYAAGGRYAALPGTRAEVEDLARRFEGNPMQVLVGADATPSAVRSAVAKMGHIRLLHLACHARVDPSRPRLSGVVLSDGKVLDVDAIYGMGISADLAVLSACETGRGEISRHTAATGFVRGFFFGGTPRVIVSNWRVSDGSTPVLMRHLYEGWLQRGLSPGAALQAAQRTLAKSKATAHPYHWAGFALWGVP